MPPKKPPYVIVARKPTCNCILMISTYDPKNDPKDRLRDLAQEVSGCIKSGLLIQTIPFDQHPLKTEPFGCTHTEGQLVMALE